MKLKIFVTDSTQISKVFEIRTRVFVEEQQVDATIERDCYDKTATHVLATYDEKPIGCARIIFEDNCAHVGRLAVLKEYRNKGFGKAICKFIVDYCRNQDCATIWLNSQIQAKDFYQNLGFKSQGEIFIEANMYHVKMVLSLTK